MVDAGVAVVLEQALELAPDDEGGGAVLGEEAKQLRRDPRVNPLQNGEVVPDPNGVGGGRRVVVVDVAAEAAPPEVDKEQMTPVVVAVRRQVEDDGDERGYIGDGVNDGGWGKQNSKWEVSREGRLVGRGR